MPPTGNTAVCHPSPTSLKFFFYGGGRRGCCETPPASSLVTRRWRTWPSRRWVALAADSRLPGGRGGQYVHSCILGYVVTAPAGRPNIWRARGKKSLFCARVAKNPYFPFSRLLLCRRQDCRDRGGMSFEHPRARPKRQGGLLPPPYPTPYS